MARFGTQSQRFLLMLVAVYQRSLSVFSTGRCRFYPSCSHYMQQAIACHGVRRGILMGLARLCRCRPGCSSFGYDPVPGLAIRGEE